MCAADDGALPLRQTPGVVGTLEQLGAYEWVLIDKGDRRLNPIWRQMMEQHHPQGAGPLFGEQLRYLLHSPTHGWLGGAAFSAAALQVRARDRFIGWDAQTRRAHLNKLVCNSRFLILPTVRVPHLASQALAQTLRRLAADWTLRYAHAPVLVETFVDRARYQGTCYRAANWQWVGDTRGRGRQDRDHAHEKSIKAVYVYPLCRRWRAPLGVTHAPQVRVPDPDWAQEEYATARLPDARLNRRLITLARDFAADSTVQVPQACDGDRARTKAAYRFFDHAQVSMQRLLEPHYDATLRRCRGQSVILAAQDSTSLNYTAHPATDDLGPLNTRSDRSRGLWMHDTLALTPDGVPLGLLDIQCWARDPAQHGKAAQRYQRALEDKESAKWLVSFAAATRLQQQLPETTVVSVGDRESDLYELLVEAQAQARGAQLLVRAERTRRMTQDHGALWDFMGTQPVAGLQGLSVPRRGSAKARIATMQIRYAQVDLKAPKRKPLLPSVKLWAVCSREIDPPDNVGPIDWMLLTTIPVDNFEQACERLAWYARRWEIEVYHRTLKSGCQIQTRQLGTAKRLQACLAIDLVVAWRVFYITKLAREQPDAPCSVCFEPDQWKALLVRCKGDPNPTLEPTLRQAVRMIAALGGFLGRKSDGEPGTQTTWRGLQRLDELTHVYRTLSNQRAPPDVQRTCG